MLIVLALPDGHLLGVSLPDTAFSSCRNLSHKLWSINIIPGVFVPSSPAPTSNDPMPVWGCGPVLGQICLEKENSTVIWSFFNTTFSKFVLSWGWGGGVLLISLFKLVWNDIHTNRMKWNSSCVPDLIKKNLKRLWRQLWVLQVSSYRWFPNCWPCFVCKCMSDVQKDILYKLAG